VPLCEANRGSAAAKAMADEGEIAQQFRWGSAGKEQKAKSKEQKIKNIWN
jgi:hypothetical protein